MDGFITAVGTFYHGDYDKQSKVLNEELPKFRDKQGHFGKPVAKEVCKNYDFDTGTYLTFYLLPTSCNFCGLHYFSLGEKSLCRNSIFDILFGSFTCSKMVGQLWYSGSNFAKDGYKDSLFNC